MISVNEKEPTVNLVPYICKETNDSRFLKDKKRLTPRSKTMSCQVAKNRFSMNDELFSATSQVEFSENLFSKSIKSPERRDCSIDLISEIFESP